MRYIQDIRETEPDVTVFAYRYLMKVIVFGIIPILAALAAYFWMQGNFTSLLMISWILLIDIAAVAVDRMGIGRERKYRWVWMLHQFQVLSCGLILFFGICVGRRWEFIP